MAVISIHAPVKGATSAVLPYPLRDGYFNPRTREGCDYRIWGIRDGVMSISIHAPVKGATPPHRGRHSVGLISIHAPVKGATPGGVVMPVPDKSISIHAPVKGATRERIYFRGLLGISIHAPVKGATFS